MKTINHYEVHISDGRGIIKDKNIFKQTVIPVLAENGRYLVLDNWNYTSVKIGKAEYETCLDKPAIGLSANDNVWGNSIRYSLYTYTNKRPSTIRKEIEEAVMLRYGFFIGGLNLEVVVDGNLEVIHESDNVREL